MLLHGDGGLGAPDRAPYDRICVTVACSEVPRPLVAQLATGGRLIAPLLQDGGQELTLMEKSAEGVQSTVITEVLYVPLRGRYGAGAP